MVAATTLFHLIGRHLAAPVFGIVLGFGAGGASASDVEAFYRGKQVEMVIGYSPGGAYDLYGRLVARHLGRFIPGQPNIIARNMPGAGSRTAAMWMYNVAPKDGTVLGTVDQSLSVAQLLRDKRVTIDTNRFHYIGNAIADNNTVVAWHTTGVRTVEDARQKSITMGATGGSTSSQYPRAMNALLGTKFKIILGYPGANDINIAMERGEVDGRGSSPWGLWKTTRANWLNEKKINILVQIGLTKAPDLPDIPLLMDLAANDDDRAVLRALSASTTMGRPIFTPPGMPADRVAALRRAFQVMVSDPGFLADAKKQQLDVNPVSGKDLQKIVQEVTSKPEWVANRLREIIGAGS